MVINESLVSRIFRTYTTQIFDIVPLSWIVIALSISVIIFTFLLNITGNRMISLFSLIMTFIKIAGIIISTIVGLWISGISFDNVSTNMINSSNTTITNSVSEIIDHTAMLVGQ
jgi:amino acid transporter